MAVTNPVAVSMVVAKKRFMSRFFSVFISFSLIANVSALFKIFTGRLPVRIFSVAVSTETNMRGLRKVSLALVEVELRNRIGNSRSYPQTLKIGKNDSSVLSVRLAFIGPRFEFEPRTLTFLTIFFNVTVTTVRAISPAYGLRDTRSKPDNRFFLFSKLCRC
jgi:hypothetical protein